jgi:hypothetical protein
MPKVQYLYKGNQTTFNIAVPKSITSMWHWYKQCFKACTAIPIIEKGQVSNEDGWMIEHQEADVKWIKFDLLNQQNGEKAYIVILR